jgi:two-component system OmpR family sensor kinase
LVIVLSKSEKKSFYSFLGLYLGSSFILIVIIAYIYFEALSNSLMESKKDKMRTYGATIAAKAIGVHMHGGEFVYEKQEEYKVGMYSKRFTLLFGDEIKEPEFSKKTFIRENKLYVIDRSAQLHLGIEYIVIQNTTIFKEIKSLQSKIIGFTLLAIILISIVGYFLSRLFLKPLQAERQKLDRFIKDTTHELNTPISALLMSVGGLKNDSSKIARRIELSSNRISSIYDNLCYLLKGDMKTFEKPKKIDIKTIIEEQLTLLEIYIESKNIRVQKEIKSLEIFIDLESATRLINNLISNALKYSKPNADIVIQIKNNTLIIQDKGIGIKKDKLNQVKQRFYRANESEGGFGIGLDIVDSICKRYNINFEIESIEGSGTKVTLRF